MPVDEGFYTIREAAVELGLAESTLRRYISESVIRANKIGARLNVIPVAELERYRRERLGGQGWAKRRAPGYEPSPMARWAKDYRARKKAERIAGETVDEVRSSGTGRAQLISREKEMPDDS